jgi:signal transduction histidine kinase
MSEMTARGAVRELAELLLREVERIADRCVARMQELLPSYAKLPAETLAPVSLTNTRNLLCAVRDSGGPGCDAEAHFRLSGKTRLDQGIRADEMLQAWRIGLEVVREEAHEIARRRGLSDAVLLEFVEATLRFGDIGMRVSAAALREGEIGELERLATEQAALRRVAELVARQGPTEDVFGLVTEELDRLLDVANVGTARFEPDGTATVMAVRGPAHDAFPAGATVTLQGGSMIERVFRTGRSVHVETYDEVGGELGSVMREVGAGWAAAGPIVVDGRLWGAMVVNSSPGVRYPPGAEQRVAQFAELVSMAVSNVESRRKVERLAAEQSALRRVAECVARHAPSEELFDLVAEELSQLLEVSLVCTVRFESDGRMAIVAARGRAEHRLGPGTEIRPASGTVLERIFRGGAPARVESFAEIPGPIGEILREEGVRSAAGAPILVEGRVWGAMMVGSRTARALPSEIEERVARFGELVSTAIANTESRAKVERLAAEQSALRRVATLVAREHSPEELFATLAEELGVLLDVDATAILRYDEDASAAVVAGWSAGAITLPLGERLPLAGENLAGEVLRSGASRRKEDYADAPGTIAATVRRLGIRSAVASPIVVEGSTWGVIAVLSRRAEPLASDTETRLWEFSRHAAIAVANAKGRADLAQSRARIVRTGDEARRRFERDLHDGAQQRLVSLGLELHAAEAAVPSELGDLRRSLSALGAGLDDVVDDLRELSRGLHPAVLSEGGLAAALSSLARRSAVPVELRLELEDERLEEPVEVTAYYVTSEALTNSAKHSHASRIDIDVSRHASRLNLTVRDDGSGGADPANGTGLTGLVDRVEAIGGTIDITSPADVGTTIHVTLPIRPTG